MEEKNPNKLTDRIKKILEEADFEIEEDNEYDKSHPADKGDNDFVRLFGVSMVILLLIGAVLCAGCIDNSSISFQEDNGIVKSSTYYYYIPSLDKVISSTDPDFEDYKYKYMNEWVLRYKTIPLAD